MICRALACGNRAELQQEKGGKSWRTRHWEKGKKGKREKGKKGKRDSERTADHGGTGKHGGSRGAGSWVAIMIEGLYIELYVNSYYKD